MFLYSLYFISNTYMYVNTQYRSNVAILKQRVTLSNYAENGRMIDFIPLPRDNTYKLNLLFM